MKKAIFENGKIQIVETDKPVLDIEGAIIKVLGCGLCGSDLVKIKHNQKNIVLGHEVVGLIEQINTDCDFKIGNIVALGHHYPCLDKNNCEFCKIEAYSMCPTFKQSNIFPNGFSEFIKVNKNHLKYTIYKMNPELKNDEKAFLEPLSCVIRAIRRAGFNYKNEANSNFSALVLGLGSIGLLTLKALKAFKVNAFGFDIAVNRMELAKNHGFNFDENRKYDTVFLTAGHSKAIETALKYVINGGKIIVFASIEDDLKGFSNNELYYREISVIPSYSPSVDDYKISAELLNTKQVDLKNLSTHYKLDNLACAVDDSLKNRVFKAYIEI